MADIIGTPGDDVLPGTVDDDFIAGLAGNDTITAGDGADQVNGGLGNDLIDLGEGNVQFAQAGGGDDTVYGGAGNDNIFGESTTETQNGITGNDVIFAGGGNDFLRGGLGDDYLDGGTGSDRASYYALASGVTVDLRIQGVAQNTGAGGFDTLVGIENLAGTEHADTLTGNNLANWIWSHGGADTINGLAGDDTFWLPQGDGATVRGGQGADVVSFRGRIDGTTNGVTVDLTTQGSAQDVGRGLVTLRSIEGAEGSEFDDTITGNGQDNLLSGFTGSDTVNGGGGDDLIYGDFAVREVGEIPFSYDDPGVVQGADVLNGGAGDDAIYANGGNDTVDGGGGDDTISGDAGADRLTGGGGDDQFLYASAAESTSTNFDTLVGFNFRNTDMFDLPTAVTSVSTVNGGALDLANFDTDLSAALNAGVLSVGEAAVFNPNAGSFAGQSFLVVDANGVAGYQAGEDYVFQLEAPVRANFIDIFDFI
ncbi:MAG: hypothetical protein IV086_06660 [Hyphomonadaceae bacterium]|nr:MAG: Hemolysin-type calcium-binding region [Caulobacteraceae bacterium]MBT9445362.1 hypothetical protein [Hyphomonadaceae bacterium]TPW05268.1 MAG: Hemolysin-type calcium-binding region [Alphaproteobacteria bacterium]